jgi:hypothetical protein
MGLMVGKLMFNFSKIMYRMKYHAGNFDAIGHVDGFTRLVQFKECCIEFNLV